MGKGARNRRRRANTEPVDLTEHVFGTPDPVLISDEDAARLDTEWPEWREHLTPVHPLTGGRRPFPLDAVDPAEPMDPSTWPPEAIEHMDREHPGWRESYGYPG